MVAQATHTRPVNEYRHTAVAAIASGEVMQLPNGRAGVYTGLDAAAAGDRTNFTDDGCFTVIKTATQVWLKGAPLWWDHSAGKATCVPQFADKDFYLGTAADDVASAATSGDVYLNVEPRYITDTRNGAGDVVPVLTAGTPFVGNRGGALDMLFSATAEAQKLDFLSKRSFPLGSDWIMEALVELVTTADADVADLSIGVANTSHASDADSITESAFFHFDLGADLNIDCESDDGTTEVAATDSTIDIVAGTPVLLALDGRDPTNVKYYINGVEVLAATADLGDIQLATGPLKLLVHFEKSSNDTLGHVRIHHAGVRMSNEPA